MVAASFRGAAHGYLTPREIQVLDGIAHGKRHAEIAEDLGITANTVKTFQRQIVLRLGARNTPHAVYLFTQGKGQRP